MASARRSLVIILAATSILFSRGQEDETETGVNVEDSPISLFGGDVRLTVGQEMMMINEARSPFGIQNAVLDPDIFDRWEESVVPYVLDGSLGSSAITAINAAIAEYESRTCIRFVERTSQLDYVRFFVDRGCYSYIGKIGGRQDISIGSGCEFVGIVIHEIFHALGRFHEQSRPDRDMYVTINEENIGDGFENNFEIADSRFVTTQGVDYDFGSVMHYSAFGFSSNGQPTIEPLPGHGVTVDDLGQRAGFSDSDITHANLLYCEGMVQIGQWGEWSSWSSCSKTCSGGSRTRTRECPDEACEGQNIETENCNSDVTCPIPSSWGAWTSWSLCSAECGGGSRSRQRSCENGNDCVGVSQEFEDCNEQECEEATEWGEWGSWSSCTKTCATGERRRNRQCLNGNSCEGLAIEVENCNEEVPCTPDPTSGEWSEWSSCTKTCGTGTRTRSRNCHEDLTLCDTQEETCNTDECPTPEPELRGMRRIGCYYVPTFATPLKLLEGTSPDLSDNPFTRREPIRKCGIGATENDYDAFSIALGICISGSSSLRDYQTFELDVCNNGVGGYEFGYYFMDVYELFDVQSFADSAGYALPQPSPSPSPSPESNSELNSGDSLSSIPSIMLISLAVLLSICHILFNNLY